MPCEGNAEEMLLLRAAALTGRWDDEMQRALQSACEDGYREWHWSSPDMPNQLKTEVDVNSPAPQNQSRQEHRRIPA
jgi:hypothetical protein